MIKNQDINAYLKPVKESETLLINQISLLRANNNEEAYKFGFGQSPFPVPNIITNSLASAAHRKEYMSVQGHLPLREAIVNFHYQMENKSWYADNIIIGAGSKIIIFCIMAAFEKAEILLPAPSWVSYEPQAKLVGHRVNWIKTTFEQKWSLTAETLEQYCVTRKDPNIPLILILNYPNNPTGQSYNDREIKALAKIMKKNNIIVIADEIYSLLKFSKIQPSIAKYYPEGCIVTSGLSKWCGAGGWRLGFCHVPPELGSHLLQGIIGVASETYSCAASPIQIAATTAYQEIETAKDFLNKQISLLSLVNEYCHEKLNQACIKVHPCVGGFYLFPDFSFFKQQLNARNIFSSSQLTNAIMDATGVALLPGSAFGMSKESLTARLAFVDFDGKQILDTLNQPNFDPVKRGINKLCDWVKQL